MRLDATDIADRTDQHRSRVTRLLADHPAQAPDGSPHPVWGFLFRYYSHKPALLMRWHPGHGVDLDTPTEHAGYPHYVPTADGHAVTVDPAYLETRARTVGFVDSLLRATADRAPRLNCFGMHEWAMVYRASASDIRHRTPLRLSPAATDAAVEASELRCTHFDAFRFFTEPAGPRNVTPLTRATQVDSEQPGCVHAGMDLYKWAYKLSPLVDSDLVADALEVAFDLRELDMRASPYDFAALGFGPIAVETPAGRAEYVRRQTVLTDHAALIRRRLIDSCAGLIDRQPPR
ncbi:MAG: 3-methyladenine DNA glycosylase [Williamsia sp.]|nr:3-methyladenine DNA glycosylase [Williamsia sp.]